MMFSFLSSLKSHSPSMDVGMADLQKQFIGYPLHYFLDSSCFFSVNTISIKCVLLRMCTPSILLSIHSSNSGDNLTATYSFTTLNTYLQCNTSEHINTCFTISIFVNYCKTIKRLWLWI